MGPVECLLTQLSGAPGTIVAERRRPQQSGFTAGRSTAYEILALRLLSNKSAFDFVDRGPRLFVE